MGIAIRLLLILGLLLGTVGCAAVPVAVPLVVNPLTGPFVVITLLVVVPTLIVISAIIGDGPAKVTPQAGQQVVHVATALTFPSAASLANALGTLTDEQYNRIVNHPQRMVMQSYRLAVGGQMYLAVGVQGEEDWLVFGLALAEEQSGTSVLKTTNFLGIVHSPEDILRVNFCLQYVLEPSARRGYDPQYEPVSSGIIGARGTCH
jgi:hypothetical protein